MSFQPLRQKPGSGITQLHFDRFELYLGMAHFIIEITFQLAFELLWAWKKLRQILSFAPIFIEHSCFLPAKLLVARAFEPGPWPALRLNETKLSELEPSLTLTVIEPTSSFLLIRSFDTMQQIKL